MVTYIDAVEMAEKKREELAARAASFFEKHGRKPKLVVVKANDDTRSSLYVNNKIKECKAIGIESDVMIIHSHLAEQYKVANKIKELNEDSSVDGILLQSPVYRFLSEHELTQLIDPKKDVDCFTYENVGKMAYGRGMAKPCTAQGVIDILRHYKVKLKGRHAVVIGRSMISGKPIADMLLRYDCTVTICHSKTRNISNFTKQADIVVTCAGNADMILAEDLKPDAVVINVGFDRDEYGRLAGDVDLLDLECSNEKFCATTVTKSTGLATVMALMENTINLAEERMKENE